MRCKNPLVHFPAENSVRIDSLNNGEAYFNIVFFSQILSQKENWKTRQNASDYTVKATASFFHILNVSTNQTRFTTNPTTT